VCVWIDCFADPQESFLVGVKDCNQRDFHVTLLRLLGLDDNKLTYYHAGRFKQLSQFGGKVIDELIA
jgi:hypothetical protein